MSRDAKQSVGSTLILILLGVGAIFGGARWLAVLIPAALLVWYGAGTVWRSGRN